MTVTDQLKIFDNKIKGNKAQYNLDKLAAKISALSSNDLRKYEYLTAEDLGYKPSVVEQTRFDYSSLDKIFDKELAEQGKKEGFLKSIKNIGDKNKELLKAVEDKNEKQIKKIENQGKKQLDAIEKIMN